MFSNFIKVRLVAFLTVLVLPGGLFAAECLTATGATADPNDYPDNTGYATAIQVDQGQGSINCGDFVGDNGPMRQVLFPDFKVSGGVNGEGLIGTIDYPLEWETSDVSDPETFIKMVFIGNSGDGSRCTQHYTKNATAGKAGSGFKVNKVSNVVACTEGDPEEIPPEPPTAPLPPDITEDGCPDVFQNAINIAGDEWDVMILNGSAKGTAGGEGRSAICIDQTLNGGSPNDIDPPERCANRCILPTEGVTNPTWFPFDSDDRNDYCFADTNGRLPIQCRVCELASVVKGTPSQSDPFEPDLQFCWEQGQDAANVDFPNTITNPPPDQGNQGWTVNGKFGSTCYLISGRTRSGYPYSYWAPSGCPN